jgi:cysteine peptidase B
VAGNPLVSLSEQLLVSCDNTSYGCDGGFPNTAMEWLRDNGADTEESYPYVSGNGTTGACAPNGRVAAAANVTGFQAVPGNTSLAVEAELAAWLAAFGPVSILVDDMTQLWWTYVGGVMKGCCDVSTDHAVLLTGFDYNATQGPWWIIKNSECLGAFFRERANASNRLRPLSAINAQAGALLGASPATFFCRAATTSAA